MNLHIEYVKVSDLHLDPANARKHGTKNLDAVKGSLAKFGQQKPIVIDSKNVVLAGNGTLVSARALGWEEVAVVRSELLGPEAIAYALADNRTAELAEWDMDVLPGTLKSLSDINFDLGSIGFEDFTLEKEEEQEEEGEAKQAKDIVCPSCGHEFIPGRS